MDFRTCIPRTPSTKKPLKNQYDAEKYSDIPISLKTRERVIRQYHAMQAYELFKFGLTRRETEVAMFVLAGISTTEISRQLYITERTVKLHVTNLLQKCHVGSRQEFCWIIFRKTHAQWFRRL